MRPGRLVLRLLWVLPVPWFQEVMFRFERQRVAVCGFFGHRWRLLFGDGTNLWHCDRTLCPAWLSANADGSPDVYAWEQL